MSTIPPTPTYNQPTPQNNFNPYKHIPVKYDIFGYAKPSRNHRDRVNILSLREEIKVPWSESNSNNTERRTRSRLLEERKREKIPDISYDLDKDGVVGAKDLVLAKRYDVDNDGKLNDIEKETAYKGIMNNVEDDYVWNLENQGSNRSLRVIQKRGVIVNADNFLPLKNTYPEHPLTKVIPHVNTFTELKSLRKHNLIEDIDKKTKQWEDDHPIVKVNIDYPKTLARVQSVKEIRNENHRKARIKCGLNEFEEDMTDQTHDPTLAYIPHPKHAVRKDLKDERFKENMEESKKIASINHKDEITRLNEREDEIFTRLYADTNRKTFSTVKAERKQEAFDYNMKHFSRDTIGIHGKELPKYSRCQSTKEFWTKREGYVEKPKISSYCELKENIKYWKPKEEMLLNEHEASDSPPHDPFKKTHHLQKKNDNLITKVNNINIFDNFDPNQKIPLEMNNEGKKRHMYSWTSLAIQFAPEKYKQGGFFDNLGNIHLNDKQKANIMKKVLKVKTPKPKTPNEGIEQQQMMKKLNNYLTYKLGDKELNIPQVNKIIPIKTKGF